MGDFGRAPTRLKGGRSFDAPLSPRRTAFLRAARIFQEPCRYDDPVLGQETEMSALSAIHPATAAAVVLATAATDAVYVMFTSAVVARKRVPAATWSSIWYLLSSFAVISYTENWVYVGFAAVGSRIR